jgi:hypothetical protein
LIALTPTFDPYAYSSNQSELQIMAGRCWTELQRPLRAVPILRTVLTNFDDAYARDKALYLSWLADSCLTAGEVEEAATVADRVLDLSAGVASVNVRLEQQPPLLTRPELPKVPERRLHRTHDLSPCSQSRL